MGLIIKDKIPALMKGYPTISDKYNVSGAILEGDNPVGFGDVVVYGTTSGYFAKPTTISNASQVAGFVVATNVKLAEDWPGKTVQVNPGEAFNLLVSGFIAVELDAAVTIADIKPNAAVYVTAAGAITGSSTASAIKLENATYTGFYEDKGTSSAHKYYAEIYVR